MGCLNSQGNFSHWFGNIHLSGPCNRSCYFCIGQHMMELDKYNTLDSWPLSGIETFVQECVDRRISEINVTGTNTDPMLYNHTSELKDYLNARIPNLLFGIRTNAVRKNMDVLRLYDRGSITICSLNEDIYRAMMGQGSPPNLLDVIENTKHWTDTTINIVLGDENVSTGDIFGTINHISSLNVDKINLREPYGQPRIGNPLLHLQNVGEIYGNPYYFFGNTMVTYWDVHYTEVESVNLYANGRVSTDYPITRGHSDNGAVFSQENFTKGRHNNQWVG